MQELSKKEVVVKMAEQCGKGRFTLKSSIQITRPHV